MIVHDHNMKIFMSCEIINIDETLCLTCIRVYMDVGTAGGGVGGCLFLLEFFFFFDESFNSFNLLLTPLCMIC